MDTSYLPLRDSLGGGMTKKSRVIAALRYTLLLELISGELRGRPLGDLLAAAGV